MFFKIKTYNINYKYYKRYCNKIIINNDFTYVSVNEFKYIYFYENLIKYFALTKEYLQISEQEFNKNVKLISIS